jgi:hypothetical protein
VLHHPPSSPQHIRSPLTEGLIALAGIPDDSPHLDDQLVAIARLTADLVTAVSYASVTAYRHGSPTTVATSSEVAVAVDLAQYADDSGPCLLALDSGAPVAVPDVSATMQWPDFRDTAYRMGLRASLSIPLFAGRGTPIAALNLYGHDPATMAPLTAAVWAACDPAGRSGRPQEHTGDSDTDGDGDGGAAALAAGLAGALQVQALIQQAIGTVIADDHGSADAAYLALRLRAADKGISLVDVASAVLAERQA